MLILSFCFFFLLLLYDNAYTISVSEFYGTATAASTPVPLRNAISLELEHYVLSLERLGALLVGVFLCSSLAANVTVCFVVMLALNVLLFARVGFC